jgi:hypothetical protein
MTKRKQIEQQFYIVFSSANEDIVLQALNRLLELGLTNQQVVDGIEAGCRTLVKDPILFDAIKEMLNNPNKPSAH